MGGIEQLREADEELRRPGRPPRDRLRTAAQRFWRAVYEFESWPPPVQDRAAAVLRRLFRGGVIDETVRRASDATIDALSGEIRAFCEEAERHADREARPRPGRAGGRPAGPFRRRAFGDFL